MTDNKVEIQSIIKSFKDKWLYEKKDPYRFVMDELAQAFDDIQKSIIELEKQCDGKPRADKIGRIVAQRLGYTLPQGKKNPKFLEDYEAAEQAHELGLKSSNKKTEIREEIAENVSKSISTSNKRIRSGKKHHEFWGPILKDLEDEKE